MVIKGLGKDRYLYAVILILGLGCSFLMSWMALNAQQKRAEESFRSFASQSFTGVLRNLYWHEDVLENIKNLYLASEAVDDQEFSIFTQSSFSNHGSFDALGWISFNDKKDEFYWRQIEPNTHSRFKGRRIIPDTALYDMVHTAIDKREITHFLGTLEDVLFKDIHRISGGDQQYHLFLFKPVFVGENNELLGIAFSILDFEYFVREVVGSEDFQTYAIDVTAQNSTGTSINVYQFGDLLDAAPYRYSFTARLSDLNLFVEYSPTKTFLAEGHTYIAFIIFLAFLALTAAVLYMWQMKMMASKLVNVTQKAEEANRLKSDFLATMSHEIRTPMNGILGMAELIMDAKPSQQISGYSQIIINSGETLQQIVDDILDFSKIEAGRLELDPMPVDLLDLVDELASLYSVKARDKAVELVAHYAPGTEQFIYADPSRMRQIIGNLLSNAIKFTDKGHVIISIDEDRMKAMPEDKVSLKIKVADTGIGMSEGAQKCIFEKFSQADNSTTRKYGGTGLGLSITKSLVHMMGGEISVSSVEGHGSEFIVTIPFTRNREEAHSAAKPAVLQNIRVLVVDDLPIVCQLVSEQLRVAGMECSVAESGAEALMKMQRAYKDKKPYDIVILDYLMPVMNGEMLARAINDVPYLRDTCLILMTAAGNSFSDDIFAEKGFSAYIAKPVAQQKFVESLAVIWEKYQLGYRDVLIRVDTGGIRREYKESESLKLPDANILVAEDNLVNQVFIKEILEEMDASYTVVSNGKEAINALRRRSYDLVIMDCLMPVMDGFEASRQIVELKEQAKIRSDMPVVALTANAMKGDREKCLEAGMQDYLAKPVRKRELQDVVYRLVVGKPLVSEMPSHIPQPANLEDEVLDDKAVEDARNVLKDKYFETVDVYIDNCHERVAEINAALEKGDVEAAIRPAHSLKSTSNQMGALRLGDLAKLVEYKAKSIVAGEGGDAATIQKLMVAVEGMLNETERAFERRAA
ncbi:MAG TPA: response regulator [Micavibrio sp.]|nr:response regulator [Micavibrio sp.]HIL27793.1 response regulator [Micavibrio sp.]